MIHKSLKRVRAMARKMIELGDLVRMASEREITAAAIVESRDGWHVRVTFRDGESILAAPDGAGPRRWESPVACAAFLAQETGILHVDVLTVDGELTSTSGLGYGNWLQAEVQSALADLRPAVASEEVERDFEQIKSAFRKRLGTGQI